MGERLVFKCIRSGKMIATIYYHWSAFTLDCYKEALKLVNGLKSRGYNRDMTDDETKLMLLDILLKDCRIMNYGMSIECGGPDSEDFRPFIKIGYEPDGSMYNVSRNCGLLSITEKMMQTSIHWAERLCVFNFDDETFENNIFPAYEYDDEILEDCDTENLDELEEFRFPDGIGYFVKWADAERAFEWFRDISRNTGWILGKISGHDGEPDMVITQVC